ncbi:hypothetical protein QUF79_00005 [Fictibacillus enclensis]|nr:hypothetical protein [Fictibacillus enclensis]
MMKKEETRTKTRKVRCDKKRDVKPTIPLEMYHCISRPSYVTNRPIKDVAEDLCNYRLSSKAVIEKLSLYFRRDYLVSEHIFYLGDLTRQTHRIVKRGGIKKRVTIRFQQTMHDNLADLAYALDLTVSSATMVLLEMSIKQTDIVKTYIESFVHQRLDPERIKQLKEVLKFINKNNPCNEEVTLAQLISFLMEEFKDRTIHLKHMVDEWLQQVKN